MNETVSRLMEANLLGVFNERDGKSRAAAIRSTYAPDVRWTDDEGVSVGREALEARAQGLQATEPGIGVYEGQSRLPNAGFRVPGLASGSRGWRSRHKWIRRRNRSQRRHR